MTDQQVGPWYKQPWLWFLLAPLIATVLYSIVYISASIATHDGVVLQEYDKRAKAFHEDNTRLQAARDLELSGELKFDLISSDITLQMQSIDSYPLPANLLLTIGHPTKASLDIKVQMRQLQNGYYTGEITDLMKGRKTLILEPEDKAWQLITEVEPPYDEKSVRFGGL